MNDPHIMQLHATGVAIDGRGVMLRGAPGSGKSDLALRLIDQPGLGIGCEPMHSKLIGDDQIILKRDGDNLVVLPAPELAGMLEIRGIGIVQCPYAAEVPLALIVDLVPTAQIERLPEPVSARFEALGVLVPRVDIDPRQPSATARVRAALESIGNTILDS